MDFFFFFYKSRINSNSKGKKRKRISFVELSTLYFLLLNEFFNFSSKTGHVHSHRSGPFSVFFSVKHCFGLVRWNRVAKVQVTFAQFVY